MVRRVETTRSAQRAGETVGDASQPAGTVSLQPGESVAQLLARAGISGRKLVAYNRDYFRQAKAQYGQNVIKVGVPLYTHRPSREELRRDALEASRASSPAAAPQPMPGAFTNTTTTGARLRGQQPQQSRQQPNFFSWLFGGNRASSPAAPVRPSAPATVNGVAPPAHITSFVEQAVARVRGQVEAAGVDINHFTELVTRMIYKESGFDARAHNRKSGATGLMQLQPGTAASVAAESGLHYGGQRSLYDPQTNINLGVQYFADLCTRFNGDVRLAAAGYNCGPNRSALAAGQVPRFRETLAYVDFVVDGSSYA